MDLNLFKSPYFSFIGNLGNSRKSLLESITPECWPKANLKFRSVTIFFKTVLYSPKGYENNLNTHNAYQEFRETRAQLRQEDKKITGLKLTKYLKNYAAIGEKYVRILEDIIEKNSLTDFDKAKLLPTKLKTGVAL